MFLDDARAFDLDLAAAPGSTSSTRPRCGTALAVAIKLVVVLADDDDDLSPFLILARFVPLLTLYITSGASETIFI